MIQIVFIDRFHKTLQLILCYGLNIVLFFEVCNFIVFDHIFSYFTVIQLLIKLHLFAVFFKEVIEGWPALRLLQSFTMLS